MPEWKATRKVQENHGCLLCLGTPSLNMYIASFWLERERERDQVSRHGLSPWGVKKWSIDRHGPFERIVVEIRHMEGQQKERKCEVVGYLKNKSGGLFLCTEKIIIFWHEDRWRKNSLIRLHAKFIQACVPSFSQ